jgi:predicted TIM-barrel fold metal-dependent hydrolase
MKRCAERGQFGVVWAATLSRLGLPGTTNPYWDPFYEVAQDLGVALNFHVGVGYTTEEIDIASQRGGKVNADPLAQATDQVRRTALSCMNNGRTVGGLMMSGLCDRFPSLNFVAVESGFGYFPWMVEALDWQWKISGFAKQFPQRLMPSEYFHRQIYTTFWFEDATLSQLEKYADNVLFETDFPHDTSMTPGLDSPSPSPADVIKSHIANYGEPVMRKVFWENAARLYHLRAPEFAAS